MTVKPKIKNRELLEKLNNRKEKFLLILNKKKSPRNDMILILVDVWREMGYEISIQYFEDDSKIQGLEFDYVFVDGEIIE